MATVYLLKYNNYYNRIVKKEENLAGYLQEAYLLASFNNVNFVDNDGVSTTYLCNTQESPDYVVVANGNLILHRWFVIERSIMRNGQYRFTLRRDLIVDSYDAIVNAPCFIEKAKLLPSDPFIFNKEDMTFNQIKTSEYALKDETGCAWVVGYIPKDAFPDGATVIGDAILDNSADITVNGIENWEYYQYQNTDYVGLIDSYKVKGRVRCSISYASNIQRPTSYFDVSFGADSKSGIIAPTTLSTDTNNPGLKCNSSNTQIQNMSNAIGYNTPANWTSGIAKTRIALELRNYKGGHSILEVANFASLDGKILYDSSTKLYSRIVVQLTLHEELIEVSNASIPTLFTYLDDNITRNVSNQGENFEITDNANQYTYTAHAKYKTYRIILEQVPQQVKATISKPEARYHLEDQPYDMFAIPYSNDLEIYKNGTKLFNANKSLAVNIATQIAAATGSGNVYDVQILPYCPVRYCILDDGTFDIKTAKVDYVNDKDNNNIGVILWATTSAFTIDIPYEVVVEDAKVESQTDMWRLTSPNFNGQFEFNAAKNGGVKSFNVDCNYKPFAPYIHINPNFGLLYGQDFNDARGLICGGDFSLPQLSNAWANYQLSNKNYQAIFDRQIQNMEVNNRVQRTREITEAALGSVQAGIGGAVSGSMLGPIGAVVGGAASMAASAAGGAADVMLNDQLRNEALDYKRDMFGYDLGNIQALPTSITKTSAFTYNNKIFPILEYYTCTDKEKQALKDKIKYNGMTVMRIGTIGEFLGDGEEQYIKGRIIRIEGIEDDYHYMKAIAEEIFKGAFFK